MRPPIVLTADEYEMLESLAESVGLSAGKLLRSLILQEALRRDLLSSADMHDIEAAQQAPAQREREAGE